MGVHIALLRAVNVGGTGRLLMSELKALCESIGFEDVRTYIQTGNVVFRSELSDKDAGRELNDALAHILGKAPGVMVRNRRELEEIVAHNPFPDAKPNYLMVNFLPEAPPRDALASLVAPDGERAKIEGREVYIHYPKGSGRSRLSLRCIRNATSRNLTTVSKLAEIAASIERH